MEFSPGWLNAFEPSPNVCLSLGGSSITPFKVCSAGLQGSILGKTTSSP